MLSIGGVWDEKVRYMSHKKRVFFQRL